jgi:hypothetical protein
MVQADAYSEGLFIEEAVTQLIAEGLALHGRGKVGWLRRWDRGTTSRRRKPGQRQQPKPECNWAWGSKPARWKAILR